MKRDTATRMASVLLGLLLPVALIVGILLFAMQHAYLKAADSFGRQIGTSMARQAQVAVRHVQGENWNSVGVAAASLPKDFENYASADKVAWLKALAKTSQGRSATYFYYSQKGSVTGSDGTDTEMYYTARPDISEVLAGTEDRAMYGPLYEEGADTDDAAAQNADNKERSGYAVYYTLPVRDTEGAVVGALALRRDGYEYCDSISSLNVGKQGFTYLVDADGLVVAVSRAEELSLVTGETTHEGSDAFRATAEQAAIRGESGSIQTTAGQKATLVYAPAVPPAEGQTATWGVVCSLPTSDLEGFMTSMVNADATDHFLVGLAVVLLAALAVFYLLWDAARTKKAESERKAREYHDILEQTLRALVGTYDARNCEDKGHGYRVAAYAREIGKHLDLSHEEAERLYFEAALHDIGMVAVPEDILRHQAEQKLTAEEARRLRSHVTVGGRILGQLTALPGIHVGAMYHQQNYDGSGYCSEDAEPARGEEIPLEARIITVADAYDEQATLNRTGLDQMLENGKGKRFDPLLADIMIQLLHDGTIAQLTIQTEEAMRSDSTALAEV